MIVMHVTIGPLRVRWGLVFMILMLICFEKGKTTSKTTQQMINSENKIFKGGNTVKTVKFTKEIVHKYLFVLVMQIVIQLITVVHVRLCHLPQLSQKMISNKIKLLSWDWLVY